MRLQYTLPVEYGREPALDREEHRLVEVAIPSVGSPWSMSTRPSVWSASASRSGERSRRPSATTSRCGVGALARGRRAVRGLGLAESQRAVLDALRVVLERAAGPAQPAAGDRRAAP